MAGDDNHDDLDDDASQFLFLCYHPVCSPFRFSLGESTGEKKGNQKK